jgi:hypothetical protein
MKTPKQMADEWAESAWDESDLAQEDKSLPETIELAKAASAMGFVAGYKVAMDQFADADKVMCSTTMEEIKAVDTGGLMPISNLPTSAKWISVKDRLPEYTPMVLAMCTDGYELAYYGMYGQGWTNTLGTEHLNVTHWHALPAPPKEEK